LNPYFSIIVPVYNRSLELERLLKSTISQSYPNFEIIVVDDGSTEDLAPVTRRFPDSRITWRRTENRERAAARNTGMTIAKGTYVNFFDSDDVMFEGRLQEVFDFIQQNNEPPVLFTHYDLLDSSMQRAGGMTRHFEHFTDDLLNNNFLAAGSVFIRSDVIRKFLFHEDRRLATAEDWELWLRIHTVYNFNELPRSTFGILDHGGRSLHTISPEKVRARDEYFVSVVKSSEGIRSKYGRAVKDFCADRFTFIALTFAASGQRRRAAQYLLKSMGESLKVVARRRFWGTFKTMLLKW
jgi:glycosyltransferase involved in cell wall biosynthesis